MTATACISQQHINEYRRYQAAMEAVYRHPGDPDPLSFDDWFFQLTGRRPATAWSED